MRAGDQRRDQRVAVAGAQRPEFAPEPLVLLEDLAGSFDRALRVLRLERLDETVQEGALGVDLAERVGPDERLDPAHPGADRALAQEPDHGHAPGAVHVGAAAQLARVVADLDDAHEVAVLLAEQRHRAERLRLVDRRLEDLHGVVGRQVVGSPPARPPPAARCGDRRRGSGSRTGAGRARRGSPPVARARPGDA